MKKLSILVIVLLLLVIAGVAYADSVPAGVTPTLALLDLRGEEVMQWVWTFEVDGATCVYVDGELECFCPCAETSCIPEIVHTPVSTSVETPAPSETPEPTEKPKCNRGLGNGSEDCDPGNSGGKPGSAGEDNE